MEPRPGDECCIRRGNPAIKEGMTDEPAPTAAYYRQIAREIREYAQDAHLPEVRRDLLDLAERFDRMALYVEKRDPSRGRIPRPQGQPE